AFHSQAPSRKWLREIFQEMTGTVPENLRNTKRAWFTDTLEDVNGVATTIRKMTAAAKNADADLTVVTSRSEIHITDIPIKNFKPIGEFELPEYELQKLSFPRSCACSITFSARDSLRSLSARPDRSG